MTVPGPAAAAAGPHPEADPAGFWSDLYHYAWFVSFGTSFLAYAGLTLGGAGGRAAAGPG